MNKVVIYASRYGISQYYANEISTRLNIPIYSSEALPDSLAEKSNLKLKNIFCLTGKLQLNKLTFRHKLLINALYKSSKKKDISQLTENEKDIILSYEDTQRINLSKLDIILSEL